MRANAKSAHCEQSAKETNDNTARSYLTGKTGNNLPARRYPHDTERRCPAHSRSVKADLLESLTVNPDSLPMLAKALERFKQQNRPEEQVSTIQAEIAHWRQRAKNADMLFAKARISEEDWQAALQTQITKLPGYKLRSLNSLKLNLRSS